AALDRDRERRTRLPAVALAERPRPVHIGARLDVSALDEHVSRLEPRSRRGARGNDALDDQFALLVGLRVHAQERTGRGLPGECDPGLVEDALVRQRLPSVDVALV